MTAPAAIPAGPVPPRLRFSPIEACVTLLLGEDPGCPPLPSACDPTPRAAMEAVVRDALLRPPCLVSFSGGRDSSTVLALAAHVARRDGLAPPIPATNRFPEIPDADEDDWQEQVVRHVGLDDWLRLEWTDELDLLGPHALGVLERHGFAFPHNLHFHDPIMAAAGGGSVLTGVGGDEILGEWPRLHLRRLLFDRWLPGRRSLRPLAGELLPRPVRRRRERRTSQLDAFSWLNEEVGRRIADQIADDDTPTSVRWDRQLHRWWRHREVQAAHGSLHALGGDHDVLVMSPFYEARTFAAWSAGAGAAGPPPRTTGLRRLVGDLLPAEILERRSKASFTPAFFATYSREFVARWSGRGLDEALVSPEAVHREWSNPDPSGSTYTMLRQAWLADNAQSQ